MPISDWLVSLAFAVTISLGPIVAFSAIEEEVGTIVTAQMPLGVGDFEEIEGAGAFVGAVVA